ncbi:MAG: YbaB/EbfC family nucleoid-associated protein [Dehalococcoidia bacterium]|nr:MAG: YbaB/EbfC family nucleoid-associated protein [Dehalococcoidia bacterium]
MNRAFLRQAQQLQAKLEKAQEELEKTTVEASSGGGAVTVVITGQQRVVSVKISPEVVDSEDVELLEDLVLAAVNEAMRKSQELAASRLGKITGGLKIPGLT